MNVAILANKAATARDILGRLQLAYENLPKWLQQGVMSWNKGSVELENGSKMVASSTSSVQFVVVHYNMIFLDEFAFVPTNVAETSLVLCIPQSHLVNLQRLLLYQHLTV